MKASRTIIYTHGGGRLGNQIIRYAHWMAWAQAQAEPVEVVNVAFWPHANFFSEWQQHPGCMFPGPSKRVDEWARRCADLPVWCRLWPEHGDRLARAVHAMGRWRPGWKDIVLDDSIGESIELDGTAFTLVIEGAEPTEVLLAVPGRQALPLRKSGRRCLKAAIGVPQTE